MLHMRKPIQSEGQERCNDDDETCINEEKRGRCLLKGGREGCVPFFGPFAGLTSRYFFNGQVAAFKGKLELLCSYESTVLLLKLSPRYQAC